MRGFEGEKLLGLRNSLPEETRLEEIGRLSCKDHVLKLSYLVSARTSFRRRYPSHLKQNKSEKNKVCQNQNSVTLTACTIDLANK